MIDREEHGAVKAGAAKRLLLADLLFVLLIEVNFLRGKVNEPEVRGYEAWNKEEYQLEPEALSFILRFFFDFQHYPRLEPSPFVRQH